MGWDESLFHFSIRALRRFRERRQRTPEEESQIRLEEMVKRLGILAGAIAGESLELREAEKAGGFRGDRLFLPQAMALSVDPDLNVRAYLFRLAYTVTSRKMGFTLPKEASSEPDAAQGRLFALLALPATHVRLTAEFPQAQALLSELWPCVAKVEEPEGNSRSVQIGPSGFWREFVQLAFGFEVSVSSSVDRKDDSMPPQALFRRAACLRGEEELRELAKSLQGKHVGCEEMDAPFFDRLALLIGEIQPFEESSHLIDGKQGPSPFSEESLSSGSEKAGKAKEQVEEVKFGDDKIDESPLVHVFEKVNTAEEYKGGKKTLDGSDEMEEHAEALEELDLRHVIRSRERAHSVLKSDAIVEGSAPDLILDASEARAIKYDEWDGGKKLYRSAWCSVFESPLEMRIPDAEARAKVGEILAKNRRQVTELKAHMERILTERQWRNRQLDGTEIDLDALVDRYATVKSGHSPSDRAYLRRRRAEKDFATLILMDLSLSTDSWIENRRVIDVARESILILGEVLDGVIEKVAVGGFYSNTRQDCSYKVIKGFGDSWTTCQTRLVSATPTGYTRIGPALRHATTLLKKAPARRKLLLLISDGKPTDYDRYEGRYGIKDVSQAIREARESHIRVRSLAVDSQAKFYLPQMFGAGNYEILPHPGRLAASLAKIYAEIMQ